MDKNRQNEHPRLPVKSRRQTKGTRFRWQYSKNGWRNPGRKNDVAAGTDATDKPRLEAEGTGKRYQGSPLERRTQNWLPAMDITGDKHRNRVRLKQGVMLHYGNWTWRSESSHYDRGVPCLNMKFVLKLRSVFWILNERVSHTRSATFQSSVC